MDAELMRMPMMAASGAATSPMARSLSSERPDGLLELLDGAVVGGGLGVVGSSSGWTIVYFRRCQRVIGGASSPPGLPVSSLEGTGEGYRSLGSGSLRAGRWGLSDDANQAESADAEGTV